MIFNDVVVDGKFGNGAGCFRRDLKAYKLSRLTKLGKLSNFSKLGIFGFDQKNICIYPNFNLSSLT